MSLPARTPAAIRRRLLRVQLGLRSTIAMSEVLAEDFDDLRAGVRPGAAAALLERLDAAIDRALADGRLLLHGRDYSRPPSPTRRVHRNP